ncbi:MAG: hypothetical protein COB50_04170 [Thiotrichales bacterium]|nr:MAG: hypothetical protein COB50_04170 [Thiotrichales bacterium]
MIIKIINFSIAIMLICGAGSSSASFKPDVSDVAALQRGARTYMNYCVACHTLKHVRFDGLAKGIGISKKLMAANLIFSGNTEVLGNSTIGNAMQPKDAEAWFGVVPPDLSLVARSRGTSWLYDYLLGFYADPSKTWGVNNKTFPDVAMPHVLATEQDNLSAAEYRSLVADLVTFLAFVGEPHQLERQRIGVWVLLFLGILLVFAYLLKREYWKSVK